jgi:pimeloyl-ACP methyl ester carboxylesterase
MNRVTSKDGTSIAYERQGSGPAVILVTGGLDDGSENAPLAAELAEHFSVYNYNRRGRGDSGDTPPYAVEREIEDIEALVAEAGGSAHLYGVSTGGALALEAAQDVAGVRSSPYWPGMEAIAHTLAYDAACLGDGRPPAARLARITRPTLVATGDAHPPGAASWVLALDRAADAVAASIPRAERQTLEGQSHVVDPKAFTPVLERFFRD